jgi:hypothetical protein
MSVTPGHDCLMQTGALSGLWPQERVSQAAELVHERGLANARPRVPLTAVRRVDDSNRIRDHSGVLGTSGAGGPAVSSCSAA